MTFETSIDLFAGVWAVLCVIAAMLVTERLLREGRDAEPPCRPRPWRRAAWTTGHAQFQIAVPDQPVKASGQFRAD